MSESIHHELPSGTLLHNRYRIESVIGQGGFGITYKALDQTLSRPVCIKELFLSGHSTRGAGNTVQSQGLKDLNFEHFCERFIEEAGALARFRHPGIVQVLDVFRDNGTAYCVMEYIKGETLKERVQSAGNIPLKEARKLMQGLLDATEEVHRMGMLHRDIKPDNVMLREDGSPVLIDFGSARSYTEAKTITQTAILTPGYAPLEQYSEKARRGSFTDIYALGATFYFLLTGKRPLAATDRQLETMQAPHQLQQDIPDTLSSAIMLALNVKPEDRFQTVAEFRSALNPLKNEKPALEQSPAAPEKQKTEGRGKKYRALLWLGAALVFIAATAYFINNNQRKSGNQKSGSTENLNPVIENLINKMVEVEGGTFTMGCNSEQGDKCKQNEIPVHSVQLNSFYIGKFEVTQEQWDAVMGSNPSRFNDCADCPVENISWDDAQYFINKLNSMTEKEFRLPTEAEWEYAARGGKNSKGFKYAGSDEIALVAWHGRNSGNRTHKVGEKIPNELGLYDMTGNVWEWCSDWYAEDYYSNSPKNNPTGPAFGTYRVLRGGSWYDLYPVNSRISYRLTGASETAREYNFGLRLVCEDL